jgi:hypothetical protein
MLIMSFCDKNKLKNTSKRKDANCLFISPCLLGYKANGTVNFVIFLFFYFKQLKITVLQSKKVPTTLI